MSILSELIARVDDLSTRIGTEFKTYRSFITGSATGTFGPLDTTAQDVEGAINELFAASGGAPSTLDDLTDVVITAAATGDIVFYNGTNWVDELGTTHFEVAGAAATAQANAQTYADGLIAAADAMVFKGVIDASANPNYPAADRGWTYRISVAGKIGGASGPNVEVGDLILSLTDGTASGDHATVGAQWSIIQSNIDGAITGPASSVSGQFASFNGTTGKIIADSGISIDVDDTLAADSDARVPSQQAVKAYTYSKIEVGAASLVTSADFVATFEVGAL